MIMNCMAGPVNGEVPFVDVLITRGLLFRVYFF